MPNTPNIGLSIPATGSQVGVWGEQDINPDMVVIDGMLGGVAAVALSNVDVTLTGPAGVSATAGPTQAQNAILRFSGALTANVRVTLPMPGFVIVENLTTGNFVVTFRAATGGGEIIATPQGSRMQIFNDGTNVRFMGDISSFPGKMEFLGGAIALPAWMAACTVKPFLVADGSLFNVADYPALGALYGSKFGGNGITTSATPDMQGRLPLAYDGTGARITTVGCGIDGQTIGAAGGSQNHTLTIPQVPVITPAGIITGTLANQILTFAGNGAGGGGAVLILSVGNAALSGTFAGSPFGGGAAHNNVQPSMVAGIWLIKT